MAKSQGLGFLKRGRAPSELAIDDCRLPITKENRQSSIANRQSQSSHRDERAWLDEYFARYREALLHPVLHEQLIQLKTWLLETSASGKKVIIAGNGGSAAIASHCTVDLTKCAKIRCINFNEADLITCFANDYGYEHWVEKALEAYADSGDLVILISSSGQSANMVNAARYAVGRGLRLVTFTGFRPDNPLQALGALNLWVESDAYNVIEMTHHIWLLAACDLIVEAGTSVAREITNDQAPITK